MTRGSLLLPLLLSLACAACTASHVPDGAADGGPALGDGSVPPCDPVALTGCAAPLACYPVAAPYDGLCMTPSAEDPGLGESCALHRRCSPGLVCIGDAPPGMMHCHALCDAPHPCRDGSRCVPSPDVPWGACL